MKLSSKAKIRVWAFVTCVGAAVTGGALTTLSSTGSVTSFAAMCVAALLAGIASNRWPALVAEEAADAAAEVATTAAADKWRAYILEEQADRKPPPLPGDLEPRLAKMRSDLSALGHGAATLIEDAVAASREVERLGAQHDQDQAELAALRTKADDGARAAALLSGHSMAGPAAYAPRSVRLALGAPAAPAAPEPPQARRGAISEKQLDTPGALEAAFAELRHEREGGAVTELA